MPLTKLDIGSYINSYGRDSFSSVCACNPTKEAGVIAVAGASAVREGIGSQVAVKLALESFIEGAIQGFGTATLSNPQDALEVAFRSSNSSVFDFGTKLAAGGRMAASMVAMIIARGAVAIGRVGSGSAYLVRAGEVYPFFEEGGDAIKNNDPAVGNFIGTQALVTVELASVELRGGDNIVLLSDVLEEGSQDSLAALGRIQMHPDKMCEEIVSESNNLKKSPLQYGVSVVVGPEAIYLGASQLVTG
jgi:hypothetical protein